MRLILLVMIGLSALSGADIAKDKDTKLYWQDNAEVMNTQMSYNDAISYCSDLELGGKDDWRLPSITELESLVDLKRNNPATKSFIKNTTYGGYWSSTVYASNASQAWFIAFMSGYINYGYKSHNGYVRCVRSRPHIATNK